jgi:hypothetical protein
MLFGCPLPDELDGASIGQRAVFNAFEMILGSAAKMHPQSLYDAICNAHTQQGDDIKLVSTCLCICTQSLLMSLFIVSPPTGNIVGLISAEWWSRSC